MRNEQPQETHKQTNQLSFVFGLNGIRWISPAELPWHGVAQRGEYTRVGELPDLDQAIWRPPHLGKFGMCAVLSLSCLPRFSVPVILRRAAKREAIERGFYDDGQTLKKL